MNRKRFFALITGFALVATLAAPLTSFGMTVEEMQQMIAQLNQQIQQLQAQLAALGETPTGLAFTGIPASFTFDRNLRLGSSGDDVKYLQIVLNADPATRLRESGVGAPGQETSYFGPLTEAAVIKFQEKYANEVLTPFGLTSGTGFVGTTTRAKLNSMLVEATEPDLPLPPPIEEEEEEVPVEGLSVSVGPNNPASTTLVSDTTAGGQALVPMLELNFSSDTAATITNLKVRRSGISIDSDINNAYLYDGETRLAEMQSISNGVIAFNDSAGLFTVPAGGSKNVMVRMDIIKNAGSGKTIAFSLNSASDVTANVSPIEGNFPISGNIMSVASVTDLGQLTVANVTDPGTTIDAQDNTELWRFSLAATNQDLAIDSLRITNIGSAETNAIQDLKLFDGGVQIGPTVDMLAADRTVTFDLSANPLEIKSGVTKNISLRGDIVSGANRTFRFSFQRSADIQVRDTGYGVYLTPNGNTTWSVQQATNTTTINAGALSVARAVDSPSGNVAENGTGVVLAKYEFKATGENVRINTLTYACSEASADKTLKNVRLVLDGDAQIGAQTSTVTCKNSAFTETYAISLGNSFTAQAGQTHYVTVVADITGTAADTDKITVRLVQGNANAQGLSSLTAINVPAGNRDSHDLTISAGALSGSKNIAIGNVSTIPGVSDKVIASYNVTAGAAEGVSLYSASVIDRASDDGANGSQGIGSAFSNVHLAKSDGTRVSQIIASPSSATGTTLTFNISPALDIPAGSSVRLDVVADVLGGAVWNATDATKLTSLSGVGQSTNSSLSWTTGILGQEITVGTSGTLSVSVDASTPADQQVVMGSTDVTLGLWKFEETTAGEGLNVNQIIVGNASNSGAGGDVYNLKLFVDGVQVGSTVPAYSAANNSGTATFGSSSATLFTVPAGTYKVVALKASVTSPLDATGAAAVQPKMTTPATINGAAANTIIARGAQSGAYATLASANTTYSVNSSYAYRTKLTAGLNSASPSGSRTRKANDTVFKVDLAANSAYQVVFRAGNDFATGIKTSLAGGATTNWASTDDNASGDTTDPVITADTSVKVAGSSSIKATPSAGTDTLTSVFYKAATGFGADADLSAYNGVGFWIRTDGSSTAGQLKFLIHESAEDLTGSDESYNLPALTANDWIYVFQPFSTTTTTRDAVKAFGISVTAGLSAGEVLYLDDIRFYKDALQLDLAASANLSTTPVVITAKDSTAGVDFATGYYYGTATAGSAYFIPFADFTISAGDTRVLDFVADTTALLSGAANLSPSISLGSSASTLTSPGGVQWYDGRPGVTATIPWVDTTPSVVSGHTLEY